MGQELIELGKTALLQKVGISTPICRLHLSEVPEMGLQEGGGEKHSIFVLWLQGNLLSLFPVFTLSGGEIQLGIGIP